jgi:hypothetical protein
VNILPRIQNSLLGANSYFLNTGLSQYVCTLSACRNRARRAQVSFRNIEKKRQSTFFLLFVLLAKKSTKYLWLSCYQRICRLSTMAQKRKPSHRSKRKEFRCESNFWLVANWVQGSSGKQHDQDFRNDQRPSNDGCFGKFNASKNVRGDQIGRIFAYWAIVFFGNFLWKLQKESNFWATCFPTEKLCTYV